MRASGGDSGQTWSSSIGRSVDRRYIGTIVWSGYNGRRISTIGLLMYCMYISTIFVYVGSDIILATGSFGWQYNTNNGVILAGILA